MLDLPQVYNIWVISNVKMQTKCRKKKQVNNFDSPVILNHVSAIEVQMT